MLRTLIGVWLFTTLAAVQAQPMPDLPAPEHRTLTGQFLPADEPTTGWLQRRLLAGRSAWSLRLAYERHSLAARHQHFELLYRGMPVYGQFARLTLTSKRQPLSLDLRLTTPTQVDGTHQYPIQALMGLVTKQMAPDWYEVDSLWLAQDNALQPIYRLRAGDGSGQEREWMVDARQGRVLGQEDRVRHLRTGDTTGIGRVFIPNPCTVADVAYGDWFVDSADAHQQVFESLLDTVLLPGLTFDETAGLFRLVGPYVRLEARRNGSPEPATSSDGTFYFTRDQSGFEDVMAYYHLDRYQRYVQSLGFTNLQNQPLSVDAHGFTSDASAFVPNNGNSYLLFGIGNVDDAEDADVLIHEYAHALSYAASPETNSGRERKGLDEGIGDYFAAAYSRDITPNRWFQLFNWDGHNEFWNGRWANATTMYPPNSLSIYVYGEIWVSALMKMRADVGAADMDRLVLEFLYRLVPGMTFPQAGKALIETDSLLYGGSHRETIRSYLCDHDIDADPSADCTTVGADAPLPAFPQLSICPNPNQGQFEVMWEGPPGDMVQLSIINALGQEVYRSQDWQTTGPRSIKVALPAGTYWLQARSQSGRISRQLVITP